MTAARTEAAVDCALQHLRSGAVDDALALLQGLDDGADDPACHGALGMVHLAQGNWEQARVSLRVAVSLGDRRPETLLNLALAEDRTGDRLRGRALMEGLHERMPDWEEPVLRLAESRRRGGELQAAERDYREVLDRNPRRPEALIGLAALLMERRGGEVASAAAREDCMQAQMLLLQCCAVQPARAEAWHALGISLMLTGEPARAEAAFARAQTLAPADAIIAVQRAEASLAAGSAEGELARLELASHENPLNIALLVARGGLLGQMRRHDEAVEVLEAAVALAPDAAIPAVALAHALTSANRIREAAGALEHAVALAPDDLGLRNNQAAVLIRLHRYPEAIAALETLIAEHGARPGALCNLANGLVSVARHAEALAVARRAVAEEPDSHVAWRTLANVLAYCDDATGPALLAANSRASAVLPRGAAPALVRSLDPGRRLRVGLLSNVLKKHPVGWLTVAAFENLDPAGFELVCLAQPESVDPIQRRFRAAAAEWHVVEGLGVPATVAQARAAGLDLLIDLGGYGDRGLLHVCAERLAPVQLKWVGAQSHSTGLAEMDWFITDRWETPPGFERFYSERLLRLPHGYVCYSPPPDAPDPVALPALGRGGVTFGCFNNLAKVTPAVIAAWAGVLRALPSARMVLKAQQLSDAGVAATIEAAFGRAGIGPDRVELRGGSPHRALLEQYNDIDIVLDPFPYSGGLTTCEALWMGVPTITMPGESFASRHSASHMANVGLGSFVARDLDGYHALALAWAADLPRLARLRAGLRDRVRASPLCDARRFGADLGAALRQAWVDWCGRQAR